MKGFCQWLLPNTANGLVPTESWHSLGSAPDGSIFVAGMDHTTNSALYVLGPDGKEFSIAGDARTASEKVSNWLVGETVQKFHTRPTWHAGKIYVASLDYSALDSGYKSRRGFHWYGYDIANKTFTDMSADEPGGVGGSAGGVVTIAADPRSNRLYGASLPLGEILCHDLARGETINLGRPQDYDQAYVYAGRVMWIDSRGHLYFTAGNPSWGRYDSKIYGHVRYYDPGENKFIDRKDWQLQEPRAIETCQWTEDRKHCFLADDLGRIYRFDDQEPSWSYLGQLQVNLDQYWTWVFHVSKDARVAYLITSGPHHDERARSLYRFDLETGRTRLLCGLHELSPTFKSRNFHTGYDGWDQKGRFYFASFSNQSKERVCVSQIDPSYFG